MSFVNEAENAIVLQASSFTSFLIEENYFTPPYFPSPSLSILFFLPHLLYLSTYRSR